MIAVTYLPLFVTLLLMFPDNRKPNVYRKMSAWKRFLIRQIPLLSVEGKRAFILGCLNRLLSIDRFLDSRCQSRLCSAWWHRIFKQSASNRVPHVRPQTFFVTI
jgi:hypothetical protein